MRIFRKKGNFSKLHDEEEPVGLLDQHEENGSTIELVAPGATTAAGSSATGYPHHHHHGIPSDDDDSNSEKQNTQKSRKKKRTIGQLPGGFISISQLVRDEPSGTVTPETNSSSDEHEEADAVADAAHEANMGPDASEFKSDLKRRLYFLMEQPSSSSAAFYTNVVVSMLIVLSAVMTTIETIPAFRSNESNSVWFKLETTMVALFTLEYLVRVFAHSDSLRMLGHFFLSPLSIIDFIAIMPFYIELIARRDTTYEFRFTILRLFRLLRLFKSYKYSNAIIMTIEVMVVALRRSSDALYALLFFVVTSVVLIATLLYFAERGVWDDNLQTFVDPYGDPSSFDSIPAAFWFVLVTITTTGYGDMVPATFIGKLITFPAMLFGVLLIALPTIIIGRNFTIVWEAMKRRQYYSQLTTSEPDDGPETHNEIPTPVFPTPPQPSSNPMSPPTAAAPGFFDNNDDAIISQLQTLMLVTRQNQEAIQHILALLEKQQKAVPGENEADIGQPSFARKRSRQYSSITHNEDHHHHHPHGEVVVEQSLPNPKGKGVAIPSHSTAEVSTSPPSKEATTTTTAPSLSPQDNEALVEPTSSTTSPSSNL